MQYTINKKLNEYVGAIPREVFEDTPKAVWAAIAISFANQIDGDRLDLAAQMIVHEWSLLNQNGIVPQSIPAALRQYDKEIDDDID